MSEGRDADEEGARGNVPLREAARRAKGAMPKRAVKGIGSPEASGACSTVVP